MNIARFTARFLSVWLIILPLGLWDLYSDSWNHIGTVPAAAGISFFLFGIEELAVHLEEPFSILPLLKMTEGIGLSARDYDQWHEDNEYKVLDRSTEYSAEAEKIRNMRRRQMKYEQERRKMNQSNPFIAETISDAAINNEDGTSNNILNQSNHLRSSDTMLLVDAAIDRQDRTDLNQSNTFFNTKTQPIADSAIDRQDRENNNWNQSNPLSNEEQLFDDTAAAYAAAYAESLKNTHRRRQQNNDQYSKEVFQMQKKSEVQTQSNTVTTTYTNTDIDIAATLYNSSPTQTVTSTQTITNIEDIKLRGGSYSEIKPITDAAAYAESLKNSHRRRNP